MSDSTDYTQVNQNDLDEALASNPNDEELHAEYMRRGLDWETGEPL